MSRLKSMMPSKEDKAAVVNHMGGVSFKLNPVDTLRMIASSSMFMEPKYYQKGYAAKKAKSVSSLVKDMLVIGAGSETLDTAQTTVNAVNAALDYDFKKTLELAVELRTEYFVRVTPQVIMVLAAQHPKRAQFTSANPGLFQELNLKVMQRADEPACQLAVWLWLYDWKKNGIPSILKRSWAARVEKMTNYEASKWKSAEAGLINLIRVCHAKGELVEELCKTGQVEVAQLAETWERLKSEGKSWKEIMETIKMPHMALLRNLRGIMKEEDSELNAKAFEQLKAGVVKGKQWPFRYYTASQMITNDLAGAAVAKDALEECIDIATEQLPKLKGRVMCLSDNSGSAWGGFTSEFGKVTIANIDNLDSVICASRADEGYVGKFGDKLKIFPVSKRSGLLMQASSISKEGAEDVGGSTENGVWLFFKNAIEKKEWWDTIFIFSDQQAGHGGLYGLGVDYLIGGESFKVGREASFYGRESYVDVLKLLREYRSKVNPKANFFTVQTGGYSDALIPEFIYRGAVLTGWTGKEVAFANKLIKQWDEIEARKNG